MKRTVQGLWWVIFVFFIGSCGFELPESLTVKGSPGVHLPLGNPFEASESINDYIGRAKIQEMIGGGAKVVLYDYQAASSNTDTPPVQTYLVRYEIAQLNLNLQNHIDNADDIKVPDLPIPPILGGGISETNPVYISQDGPSSSEPSEPLFKITLGAIKEWMKDVVLNKTAGLSLVGGGADIQNALELKIPQVGIADYRKGTTSENGDLVFTGDGYTLLQQSEPDSQEIRVYARLVGPVSGGGTTYETELNFNWDSALLYPGENGKFTGTDEVNFGDLTSYLGNDVTFAGVPAYVFISGLPPNTNGTMTLSSGETLLVNGESITSRSLDSMTFNEDSSTATGAIPLPSSIDREIDLAGLFSAGTSTLTYEIAVQETSITSSGQQNSMVIAELLINIPLEFKVFGEPNNPKYQKDYAKLDLGDILPKPSNTDSDLFGRTGKDDDLLKNLGDITITLKDYTNTVFLSDMALAIYATGKNTSLSTKTKLPSGTPEEYPRLEINGGELPYPFSPQYEILIRREEPGEPGILSIGRDMQFDFSLVVDATAAIEQTINF
ncbi:MAG: hypothetical protein LBQ30_04895 [Treponema sp.]|jgi:hypothetical protein|nr:hypothetical protein [Treponema sp.]